VKHSNSPALMLIGAVVQSGLAHAESFDIMQFAAAVQALMGVPQRYAQYAL
jgi:hypothetical protein